MPIPHVAAGTNSPSTTNEKRTIQCPTKSTETRTIQSRTQTAKQHPELGMSDLHRIQATYIPVNRGSSNAPPQRIPRVDEVESRGWGRRAPQSPSSSSFGAPQGNNKIYRSDEVFSPGEARINNQSKTQFPYKITKDISQPQVTAPIRRPQVINIGRGTGPA